MRICFWETFSLWYMNDGKVTHEAWNRLSDKEREELGAFLSGLPLGFDVSIDGRKYKLVHAAPVEKYRRFLMPGYANQAGILFRITGGWKYQDNGTV